MADLTVDQLTDDCEELNCLNPATRTTADGVRLCEGCYRELEKAYGELIGGDDE